MFLLSKLLSALTQPLTWVLWLAFAAWLLLPRKPALARKVLLGSLALALLLGWQVLPDALLRTLETSHPAPREPLTDFAGVIVLGGALEHPGLFAAHGQVPLGEAAERMTVPLALMRQHPDWRLVFTGGEGRLRQSGVSEAALARAFYVENGLDMRRVVLESKSRNTRENALNTAAMLGDACQRPWLLVTSAWHMPRAMQAFRAAGCHVTAYPVDFRTWGRTPWTEYSLAQGILRWQVALHEWMGQLAYHLTR